jgi:hypothetical protein
MGVRRIIKNRIILGAVNPFINTNRAAWFLESPLTDKSISLVGE